MTELTLNKCLNKLDGIIFCDYENNEDVYAIRQILNDVRIYIIDSTVPHKRKYNKRSFMVILGFINYLIQESYEPITNQFINHIVGLRFIVIKFKDNRLHISGKEIDFDEECNTFLTNFVKNDNYCEVEDDDEDDEEM